MNVSIARRPSLLARPITVLRKLCAAWIALGHVLGWVVSHVILAVVYFAVVTRVGLVRRLFGYDPLRLRVDGDAQTYWAARDPAALAPERCEKQF